MQVGISNCDNPMLCRLHTFQFYKELPEKSLQSYFKFIIYIKVTMDVMQSFCDAFEIKF